MTTNLTPDSRLTAAPDIVGQLVQDEAVLIMPGHGNIKVLNEVGAFIWQRLDGSHTLAEIAAAVCSEYPVSHEQATADVLAFVNELVQRDMVTAQ